MGKVKWSKNFDDYASGKVKAHQIVCVKCDKAPCGCKQCSCGWSVAPGESCPRGCG